MGQGSAGWRLSAAHRQFEEADEALELAAQLVLAGLEDVEALAVGFRKEAEDLRPRGGVFEKGPKLLEFLEETGLGNRVPLPFPLGQEDGEELVPTPAAALTEVDRHSGADALAQPKLNSL